MRNLTGLSQLPVKKFFASAKFPNCHLILEIFSDTNVPCTFSPIFHKNRCKFSRRKKLSNTLQQCRSRRSGPADRLFSGPRFPAPKSAPLCTFLIYKSLYIMARIQNALTMCVLVLKYSIFYLTHIIELRIFQR